MAKTMRFRPWVRQQSVPANRIADLEKMAATSIAALRAFLQPLVARKFWTGPLANFKRRCPAERTIQDRIVHPVDHGETKIISLPA